MSEMNEKETQLFSHLFDVVERSYDGDTFVGQKNTLQAAARKVFALIEKQGEDSTHDNVKDVRHEIGKMSIDDYDRFPQKICQKLESGLKLK